MKPLSINQKRIGDFDMFAEMQQSKFIKVKAAIDSVLGFPLGVDDLIEIVAVEIGEKEAQRLITHAISLRRLLNDSGESSDNVIDALKAGLVEAGWKQSKIEEAKHVFWALKMLMESEKAAVAFKASELLFLHGSHLHDFKVVTDMRPVFDGSRNSVVGMIGKNSIHITYSDRHENERSLEISIGLDQLQKLVREAESAIKKAEMVNKLTEEKLNLPLKAYRAHGN